MRRFSGTDKSQRAADYEITTQTKLSELAVLSPPGTTFREAVSQLGEAILWRAREGH